MRLSAFAVAAGLVLAPLAARADLTGDTVHVTFNFPTQTTVYEDDGHVVVPGATTSLGDFTISLSGSLITVTADTSAFFTPSTFNGFVITDLTSDPMITGVSENAASTIMGATPTFTSDSVALNFEGLTVDTGDFATFNLTFASPAPSSVTPEPSSFALLGTGMLGVAGMMRRRFLRA